MAEYYCAPGTYTYSATPTWNAAQEGDGLGIGVAVPAISNITFSAAPASGVISVCGASVSTTGVIGAASADAAANSLATNINATTNLAATQFSATQLRNCVYARGPSGGAPAGTCEVMSRAGSAGLNGLAAIAHTLNNVSSSAAWSGGVSGAWGWLFTDADQATIWPQAIARYTYGCLFAQDTQRPLIGSIPTPSDTVHVRANDVILKGASYSGVSASVIISVSSNFLVDDGTIWTGDTGTLTVQHAPSSNIQFTIYKASAYSGPISIGARTLGRFIVKHAGNAGSGSQAIVLMSGQPNGTQPHNSGLTAFNTLFHSVNGGMLGVGTGGTASLLRVINCKWAYDSNHYNTPLSITTGNYARNKVVFDGCEFSYPFFSGAATALFVISGWTGLDNQVIVNNCKIDVANPGPLIGAMGANRKFEATNCVGFSQFNTLCSLIGSASDGAKEVATYAFLQNVGQSRAYRLETPQFYIDWFPSQGYPTYNALLPDGVAWSQRVYWSDATTALQDNDPVVLTALQATFLDIAATKTVRVQVLIDDAVDHLVNDSHLGIRVSYVKNSDGAQVSQSTFLPTSYGHLVAALSSSDAVWTLNDYAAHVAYKLEVTTQYAIKPNTEVEVQVVVMAPSPTTPTFLFINPVVELV